MADFRAADPAQGFHPVVDCQNFIPNLQVFDVFRTGGSEDLRARRKANDAFDPLEIECLAGVKGNVAGKRPAVIQIFGPGD